MKNKTYATNGATSRLSSPFSTKKHGTYEPSDFQIMKIENNLGRMCKELALTESIRESYRKKMTPKTQEKSKHVKSISYLDKLLLDTSKITLTTSKK